MKKEKPIIEMRWHKLKTVEDYSAFWKRFRQIEKTVRKKEHKMSTENHEQSLRDLPEGAEVGYNTIMITGNTTLNGETGKKVKDNRKYMTVDFGEKGTWKVPYRSLKIGQPTLNGSSANRLAKAAKTMLNKE